MLHSDFNVGLVGIWEAVQFWFPILRFPYLLLKANQTVTSHIVLPLEKRKNRQKNLKVRCTQEHEMLRPDLCQKPFVSYVTQKRDAGSTVYSMVFGILKAKSGSEELIPAGQLSKSRCSVKLVLGDALICHCRGTAGRLPFEFSLFISEFGLTPFPAWLPGVGLSRISHDFLFPAWSRAGSSAQILCL